VCVVAGVVAGAVAWPSDTAIRNGKQGAFLWLFFAAMTTLGHTLARGLRKTGVAAALMEARCNLGTSEELATLESSLCFGI